jgi:hypothetical protein
MEVTENNITIVIHGIEDIIFYKKKIAKQIFNLNQDLKEKKETLEKVEKYIRYNCKHNWITDSIDSMKNYKLGQIITYCEYCELNR